MPLGSEKEIEEARVKPLGTFGAAWGIGGVFLLIGSAVYRLTLLAFEAFSYTFHWYHWTALAAFALFMAYGEGYRGFQRGLAPRVAARARYLKDHPRSLHACLGPFFCMGYFHAPKKRQTASILLTLTMVGMILLLRTLDQPWRGIVDLGVVVGLIWGLVAITAFSAAALTSKEFAHHPDVPHEEG